MRPRSPRLPLAARRELARTLDLLLASLDEGDLEQSELHLRRADSLAPSDPRVLYAGAELAMARAQLAEARQRLEQAIAQAPDFADAHDLLARVFEAMGDRKAMVAHGLRVLALDARADRRRTRAPKESLDRIEAEVRRVLAQLPEPLALRLQRVPIVLEPRPSFALVREGFDPRALGLFEGPIDAEIDTVALLPSRIVLYYANLLAVVQDEDSLMEQIEITVLHEIGHFFGLDEAQVEALGLG